jgi:LysR family pca operon transcriptional activator
MTDIRIRFRHLQCFLTIAQMRGVGAAAQALSITQPALSKTLRELEDALGAKLFTRDRNGMLLTRAGETFLQHAAASVASMREGVESVRQAQLARGLELRIGVLPNVAASIAPEAVRLFKRHASDTVIRVIAGDNVRLLDQLRLGELDLVVGRLAQPEYMVGLAFEHLYSERLTAAVRPGHPLLRGKRFRIAMISDYPSVLPYHGTIIRQEIERFLLAQGVTLSANRVETTSVEFAHAYVQQSDAVWFLPRGYLTAAVARNTLAELPLQNRALEGPVGITVRADARRTPAVARMIAELSAAAKT